MVSLLALTGEEEQVGKSVDEQRKAREFRDEVSSSFLFSHDIHRHATPISVMIKLSMC